MKMTPAEPLARVSSPPLSFGQPQAVTARVVIIEEQNSGFFESLLQPYQGRRVPGDLFASFDTSNSGRSHAGGVRQIFLSPVQEATGSPDLRWIEHPPEPLRVYPT